MVNAEDIRAALHRFIKHLMKKRPDVAAGDRYSAGTTFLSSPPRLFWTAWRR
jgi:hypothetical protein